MLVARRNYIGNSEPYGTKPTNAYFEHNCDCCGHHGRGLPKPTQAMSTVRESGGGGPPQVLTYPNTKPPVSGFRSASFTQSKRTSTLQEEFRCQQYPPFSEKERQGQGEPSKSNQHEPCCCGRYGNGSVEIVKIGEGPPLTLADLQSHGLQGGGFPLIEDSDWPQEDRKQVWKSPAPVCPEKQMPANGYGSWSQKKVSVLEQPSCVPRNDMAQPGVTLPPSAYRFHAASANVPAGLVATTAQTAVGCAQRPVANQPPYSLPWQPQPQQQQQQPQQHQYYPHQHQQQQQQQPCGCGGHCCNQCFAPPPPPSNAWNSPSGIMSMRKPRDERKSSLPPASHHSTEQRTSYREHRFR